MGGKANICKQRSSGYMRMVSINSTASDLQILRSIMTAVLSIWLPISCGMNIV